MCRDVEKSVRLIEHNNISKEERTLPYFLRKGVIKFDFDCMNSDVMLQIPLYDNDAEVELEVFYHRLDVSDMYAGPLNIVFEILYADGELRTLDKSLFLSDLADAYKMYLVHDRYDSVVLKINQTSNLGVRGRLILKLEYK